jgi:hypothetical protein
MPRLLAEMVSGRACELEHRRLRIGARILPGFRDPACRNASASREVI